MHPDKVILYRMGDFYEMFFDDAVTAAPILNIALTRRNKKSQDEIPMCGVPFHSVATPINKLLAAGKKVAICDQLEDPKTAKGIVKRGITRILTPGMVYDPESLDGQAANYIAAVGVSQLACLDPSTGEAFYYVELTNNELDRLVKLLPIAEIIEVEEFNLKHKSEYSAVEVLKSYFNEIATAEQKLILLEFKQRFLKNSLELSQTVIEHLEIFENYKGLAAGSLFSSIDLTKTSAGARKLKNWLRFPLVNQSQIEHRQSVIRAAAQDIDELKKLRLDMAGLHDIERKFSKLTTPNAQVPDLRSIATHLQQALAIIDRGQNWIEKINPEQRQKLQSTCVEILRALSEEPSTNPKGGGFIEKGFSSELDELIELSNSSQKLVLQMEASEKSATGISSLKIRYNSVFGYYIEITNTHKDKVPARYTRKQTLTNAERYCTDELIELEKKVLSAQSRRNDLEFQIYENLRKGILDQASLILHVADTCAYLDVIISLAWLSVERNYCFPVFGQDFRIQGSRHAVIEKLVSSFVENDFDLNQSEVMLITGPNMAGKSTLMRQIALTCILAQIGSAVPAYQAELPLLNKIFTRIGASDSLSQGLSTFMVEMKETAELLAGYDGKSLVVLDEIGRGTSTFDGMSLAQSILEYLLEQKKSFVLFATHYHELAELSEKFLSLKNAHMTANEQSGTITFPYQLKTGSASRSFGIQVAELAGIPGPITRRAKELLMDLESPKSGKAAKSPYEPKVQMSFLQKSDPVLEKIKALEINKLSPIEALVKLSEIQKDIVQ